VTLMKTLHVAPTDSAGGSLLQAVRDAGRDEEVLAYRDDLSCGPIDSDACSARAAWWAQFYDASEVETSLDAFWDRITLGNDRIVVWFGRQSAQELAFSLALADRLEGRSYNIIDVTGLRLPSRRPDGSMAMTQFMQGVSVIPTDGLKSLFGSERPITPEESDKMCPHWRTLKLENAPFRVVTATGLVSAPVDHFDSLLLKQVTTEWQKIARVIGYTMAYNAEPYMQVGDVMLLTRVVALIG
jgi:hypothetical protein